MNKGLPTYFFTMRNNDYQTWSTWSTSLMIDETTYRWSILALTCSSLNHWYWSQYLIHTNQWWENTQSEKCFTCIELSTMLLTHFSHWTSPEYFHTFFLTILQNLEIQHHCHFTQCSQHHCHFTHMFTTPLVTLPNVLNLVICWYLISFCSTIIMRFGGQDETLQINPCPWTL